MREYTNATFLVGEKYDFRGRPVLLLRRPGKGLRPEVLGLRDRCRRQAAPRPDHEEPALRLPAAQEALLPLRRGHGLLDHRHQERGLPQGRQNFAPPAVPTRPARSSTPWASPSQPTAPRTCGPWPCCRCCWATSASPAAASTPCAASPTSRARTDYGLLFHLLPGYLKSPEFDNVDLKAYNGKWTPKTKDPKSANWWGNTPKYMTSLLKAWYGDNATAENDFCYSYLPKRMGNYAYGKIMEQDGQGRDWKGWSAWG